jgi:hypothetical protein
MNVFERINRYGSHYTYLPDENGVEWRYDNHDLAAKPVKVNDPNFVQGRVPLPGQMTILGHKTDALAVLAVVILAIILLLVGGIIGSAL